MSATKVEHGSGDLTLPRFCVARGCEVCCATATGVRFRSETPMPTSAAGADLAARNKARPLGRMGVAVVESDARVRAMIQDILRPSNEFRLWGSFSTGGDALREMAHGEADLVLIEMALPDVCGIRCALELRQRRPGLRVIVTTTLSTPIFIHHAVAAGISEVLVRPFRPSQCLASLRLVACRAGRLIGSTPVQAQAGRLLNRREEQVMQGLDQRLLYEEIGDLIGISLAMVKKTQHSAFAKLHVHTRADAVAKWREIRELSSRA